MTSRQLRPVAIALVALVLIVGSALAASPINPIASGNSGSPAAGASDRGGDRSAEPSERPEASEKPESSEAPEPSEAADQNPSPDKLAAIVAALADHGITTTTDQLTQLASKVGLGGAVRVLLIAHAANKTPDEILAMFQSGMGWGQIIHSLGLSMNAGIGDIMSNGHGHGHGHGNGNGNGAEDGQ